MASHATRRARYNHLHPRRPNRACRRCRQYRHHHRHHRRRHRHRRPSHQREHDQNERTKLPNPTVCCAPPTPLEPSPSRSQSTSNMHSPLNGSTHMRTLSLLGYLLTLGPAHRKRSAECTPHERSSSTQYTNMTLRPVSSKRVSSPLRDILTVRSTSQPSKNTCVTQALPRTPPATTVAAPSVSVHEHFYKVSRVSPPYVSHTGTPF